MKENIFGRFDPFIIAEVGHNHGGRVETCKRIFEEAARCGASAVKLQKRDNATLYTRDFYDKPYDNPHSYGRTYGEHREALEFDRDQFIEVKRYAEALGLVFFATPFDIPSVDFLSEIDVPLYKISSADAATNLPLVEYIAKLGKPLIVSLGAMGWPQVDEIYQHVDPAITAFLQCAATYPNRADEMNLNVIPSMRERYPDIAAVGISDHYNGICMAEAAFVLGAKVIEKHFTLDHTSRGTDHALSLEPQGLESLVKNLYRLREAKGDGVKRALYGEKDALIKMGKSIYAAKPIAKGQTIQPDDLCTQSPLGGARANALKSLPGRTVLRDVPIGGAIHISDFDPWIEDFPWVE